MPKIPPQATRVFKGIIFDIYQWEQEMFDGSKRTFELAKRPNTIVVIPIVGNKVLYSKQVQPSKPPFMGLFGGRADEGDISPLETAKREFREETGMEAEDWTALWTFNDTAKVDWSVHYFLAKNCHKTGNQELDGGEKIDIYEATIDEFLTEIVPNENFKEYELRQMVLSGLNIDKINELKALLS